MLGDQASTLLVVARVARRVGPLELDPVAGPGGHFDDHRGTTVIDFPHQRPTRLDRLIEWAAAADLDGDGTDELIYRGAGGERGILRLRDGVWSRAVEARVARFCGSGGDR
jgi:hypothetical protein